MSRTETLLNIVARTLNLRREDIPPAAELGVDIPCDSLQFFNIIIAVETEFGVEFKPEDLPQYRKLDNIINYLDNL